VFGGAGQSSPLAATLCFLLSRGQSSRAICLQPTTQTRNQARNQMRSPVHNRSHLLTRSGCYSVKGLHNKVNDDRRLTGHRIRVGHD
jgi:hypothetical protein